MFNRKDDYLEKLAKAGCLHTSEAEILSAIEKNGEWHDYSEWRISTETEFLIKPEKFKDESWFRVSVKCDHKFSCICPTIERAIEMAGLYQQLIMHLAHQVGWPSWASKSTVSAD